MQAFPIFDSLNNVRKTNFEEYLEDHKPLVFKLQKLVIHQDKLFIELKHAYNFLQSKSKKSEETYKSYRNELEKFFLWAWLIKEKNISDLNYQDFQGFVDFYTAPLSSWCGHGIFSKFTVKDGSYAINEKWKPFNVSEEDSKSRSKHIKRELSQATKKRFLAILIAYYNELIEDDIVYKNLAKKMKKDTDIIINDNKKEKVKRFTDEQWKYITQTLTEEADKNGNFERHLFLIVCMRACYLRISELSDRTNYQPRMSDFSLDNDGWELTVFGKGNKRQDVSVPDALLPYLKRYRTYRGLSELPATNDKEEKNHPIIHKLKGKGSPTARQLDRIFKDGIQLCVDKLISSGKFKEAKEIKIATTHMLRHTGASIDSRNTPAGILSEELRHKDQSTTNRIYIHQDRKEKATYAKNRKL